MPVKDILTRSPDAGFILDQEEVLLPWVGVNIPVKFLSFDENYIEEDDQIKFAAIKAWAAESGGLATALKDSPPLFLYDTRRFRLILLDGWHRLWLAKKYLAKVPALIGLDDAWEKQRGMVVWKL